MCVINTGDVAYLIKGGNVLLPDGYIYPLSSCKWLGGKLILGIGEVKRSPPLKRKVKKKDSKSEGVVLIKGDEIDLGEYNLEPVIMTLNTPPPSPPPPPPSYLLPFSIIGVGLLYSIKKLSGLDRKLKHGSCEVRHQEAINRIAKLEGKVLRKQVVDGGKAVKAKLDERKNVPGFIS